MRWLPKAIPILVGIIALDFMLVFGAEALRIFTSPIYGLDLPSFSNLIHGLSAIVSLQPDSILKLAAFFGAVDLVIAVVFGLHLANRVAQFWNYKVDHDLLDAGLILVVLSTMLAATPAILSGATTLIIQQRLPLWLVGLAATLSMIERVITDDPKNPVLQAWTKRRARKSRIMVQPPLRNRQNALRWAMLRQDAGMASCTAGAQSGHWFQIH